MRSDRDSQDARRVQLQPRSPLEVLPLNLNLGDFVRTPAEEGDETARLSMGYPGLQFPTGSCGRVFRKPAAKARSTCLRIIRHGKQSSSSVPNSTWNHGNNNKYWNINGNLLHLISYYFAALFINAGLNGK